MWNGWTTYRACFIVIYFVNIFVSNILIQITPCLSWLILFMLQTSRWNINKYWFHNSLSSLYKALPHVCYTSSSSLRGSRWGMCKKNLKNIQPLACGSLRQKHNRTFNRKSPFILAGNDKKAQLFIALYLLHSSGTDRCRSLIRTWWIWKKCDTTTQRDKAPLQVMTYKHGTRVMLHNPSPLSVSKATQTSVKTSVKHLFSLR